MCQIDDVTCDGDDVSFLALSQTIQIQFFDNRFSTFSQIALKPVYCFCAPSSAHYGAVAAFDAPEPTHDAAFAASEPTPDVADGITL